MGRVMIGSREERDGEKRAEAAWRMRCRVMGQHLARGSAVPFFQKSGSAAETTSALCGPAYESSAPPDMSARETESQFFPQAPGSTLDSDDVRATSRLGAKV